MYAGFLFRCEKTAANLMKQEKFFFLKKGAIALVKI